MGVAILAGLFVLVLVAFGYGVLHNDIAITRFDVAKTVGLAFLGVFGGSALYGAIPGAVVFGALAAIRRRKQDQISVERDDAIR